MYTHYCRLMRATVSWLIDATVSQHNTFTCACPLYPRCDMERGTVPSNASSLEPLYHYATLYHYLLGKGGYVFGSVGLSVCLFVCGQHYSKSYERIGMKFYGRVLSSTSKNWLNFGGDLGIVKWVNEQKNTVIVVAYPDRGEGNDPEPFFFFFFFFFFFL